MQNWVTQKWKRSWLSFSALKIAKKITATCELHHANAPFCEFLAKHNSARHMQPLHNPDLAPADFFWFRGSRPRSVITLCKTLTQFKLFWGSTEQSSRRRRYFAHVQTFIIVSWIHVLSRGYLLYFMNTLTIPRQNHWTKPQHVF